MHRKNGACTTRRPHRERLLSRSLNSTRVFIATSLRDNSQLQQIAQPVRARRPFRCRFAAVVVIYQAVRAEYERRIGVYRKWCCQFRAAGYLRCYPRSIRQSFVLINIFFSFAPQVIPCAQGWDTIGEKWISRNHGTSQNRQFLYRDVPK